MILASVDAIPWGSGTAGWDDWLSGFDFGDIPPTISTEADLAELLAIDDVGLDVSDLPLPEVSPAVNFSDSFSLIFEPDAADQEEPAWKYESETPLVTNSPTVSSHKSEAGSSVAAEEGSPATKTLNNHGFTRENPNFYSSTKSSQKCENQVGTSDLDGKAQPDPSHKKQLRLLRNRELAFESRQRKKSYISDLEAKCKMLEQERNQLQQQICFSSAENAVLTEELSRLKKMKGSNGVAEPAVLFEDSLPLEFLSLLICLCLLLARLSLCVNPFLALVLRAVLPPSSTPRVKVGGLAKGQVDSNGCFLPLVNQRVRRPSVVPFSIKDLWPFDGLANLAPIFFPMKQRSCSFWRRLI